MSPWPTVALGDIAESVDYGVTASAKAQPPGPKFLRITDIQNGVVQWASVPWCDCDAQTAVNARLRAGDIVFARTGATTGKSFLIRECPADAVFASYLIRLRLQAAVEPRFISHYFQTPDYWTQVTRRARGVAQPGVNATTLKSLTIPLPPLLEQRRIAAILDKADELRTKRRTALEHLNRLTRSMFLEKFGDPLPRNSRWRVVSLSEACEKISDGTHHSPLTLKEGIPYVTAKHIREDGIDFDSAPWFISEADHRAIFSRCDPRPDDVLYIKDGATTGIAAVNRLSYQFSMLSSVALLRPRSGVMKADYLWAWLNDPVVRAGILGNMAGAAIRRLTLVKIKRLLIPVPPITQQDDFARRLKVVAMLTACERRSLTEADRLFGSLQYRAFSGALR